MNLTCIAVTRANIFTSTRSSMGHPFAFIAEWNALLPLVYFIEEPSARGARLLGFPWLLKIMPPIDYFFE